MARVASISVLIILLFNFIGYRLVSSWLEEKANDRLEEKLDMKDYDDSQLVSFKIPITNLSYYNNSNQFVRVDGQIEINSVQYKYVKRRIYNDSVELCCIPDQIVMKLHSAKDEFFKLVNDLQNTGENKKSGSHSSSSKNVLSEYYSASDLFGLKRFSIIFSRNSYSYAENLCSTYSRTTEQPPDHC